MAFRPLSPHQPEPALSRRTQEQMPRPLVNGPSYLGVIRACLSCGPVLTAKGWRTYRAHITVLDQRAAALNRAGRPVIVALLRRKDCQP